MGCFNIIFVSDLVGKIVNLESCCPSKPESPPCKSHKAILRPHYHLGHCEHLGKRVSMQLTQAMEYSERALLRHGQRGHIVQCQKPLTVCQAAFWTTVGSIDIVTDIMLIILPFWIVKGLQMRTKAKSVVILAFACRIV